MNNGSNDKKYSLFPPHLTMTRQPSPLPPHTNSSTTISTLLSLTSARKLVQLQSRLDHHEYELQRLNAMVGEQRVVMQRLGEMALMLRGRVGEGERETRRLMQLIRLLTFSMGIMGKMVAGNQRKKSHDGGWSSLGMRLSDLKVDQLSGKVIKLVVLVITCHVILRSASVYQVGNVMGMIFEGNGSRKRIEKFINLLLLGGSSMYAARLIKNFSLFTLLSIK